MVDETLGSLDWDASAADATTKRVEEEAEKALEKVKDVKAEQDKSFNEVLGMMTASYMMFSGLSQAMGGAMPQIIQTIFSIAMSSIATYKAIATAMAATGFGAPQAAIMFASLATAVVGLVATMSKQPELTKRMNGLSKSLFAVGGMISSFSM